MGEVYLALDTKLDRQVAIKALPAHLASDQVRLSRFQREAKVLASLSHPSIGAIYGLEEIGGHHYLILEFIAGETLADRLSRGPLPVDESMGMAKQIAEALEAAHEKGIVHRDLKPSNVMLTPAGDVKVLDFGLARSEDAVRPSSTGSPGVLDSPTLTTPMPLHSPTIPGAIMGTAGYMSPEQARGKPVDKRSDIFSFGCVLFEMLSGVMPFRGDTAADAIGATLHKDVELAMLPASTPQRIRELLTNCLAKDRRSRLHDIGDARIQIERVIAGREWALPAPASTPQRSGAKRSVALLAIAGLVFIPLGAALWRSMAPGSVEQTEQRCVSVIMPSDVMVQFADLSNDGRTISLVGRTRDATTTGAAQLRMYTRRLESFEARPIVGTDGLYGGVLARDGRSVLVAGPSATGSSQWRLSSLPVDGSSPATPIAEFPGYGGSGWCELSNGDLLVSSDERNFVRIAKGSSTPSQPVKMDAGRPGTVRIELNNALPGDQSALVSVISYGQRGFQYGVGVLDVSSGRVQVIVEDGGCPRYVPTGHLVFSRGDALMAAQFDIGRQELIGTPVAVWGGLASPAASVPALYRISETGTLFYQAPPVGGFGQSLATLSEGGKVESWSNERVLYVNNVIAAPDGQRVLLQIVNGRNIDELWTSPTDRFDLLTFKRETNVDTIAGVWSPDGKQVAYSRVGKDAADGIYIQSTDGGEPRRVFKPQTPDQYVIPTAWIAQGAVLLVTARSADKASLVRLSLGENESDTRAEPFLPSEFGRSMTVASRDGRLLALRSDETGKAQSWITELRANGDTGRMLQVKSAASVSHAWAADGKALYIEDERGKLLMVGVTTEPQLALSAPVEIADLTKLGIRKWTPLSGGRFLTAIKDETEGDVKQYNLVQNWTQILKKKVPTTR